MEGGLQCVFALGWHLGGHGGGGGGRVVWCGADTVGLVGLFVCFVLLRGCGGGEWLIVFLDLGIAIGKNGPSPSSPERTLAGA